MDFGKICCQSSKLCLETMLYKSRITVFVTRGFKLPFNAQELCPQRKTSSRIKKNDLLGLVKSSSKQVAVLALPAAH